MSIRDRRLFLSVGSPSMQHYVDSNRHRFGFAFSAAEAFMAEVQAAPMPAAARSELGDVSRPLHASRSNRWFTPHPIIEAVTQVFGGVIDLDPCSEAAAQSRVNALAFYTAGDNGLDPANNWRGNVFINPPFGVLGSDSYQALFLQRAVAEYEAGNITSAVLLIKAAPGYKWFDQVFDRPHCLLNYRLKYVAPRHLTVSSKSKEAPFGSVVVYLGRDVHTFAAAFASFGRIPGHNSWAMPKQKRACPKKRPFMRMACASNV